MVEFIITGLVGVALICFAVIADYGDDHPESGI